MLEYLRLTPAPRTAERIAEDLSLTGAELQRFWPLIDRLLRENVIEHYKDRLRIIDPESVVTGIFAATSRGAGYLVSSEGTRKAYIPPNGVHRALHGDEVALRLASLGADDIPTGEVVRIIRRGQQNIVGTYSSGKGFGFVTPDDTRIREDIYVRTRDSLKAKTGMKVVAKITKWPEDGKKRLEGCVVEILGRSGEPGVDILSIMRKYELDEKFSPKAQDAAAKIPQTVSPQDFADRVDRRDLPIVTIDGEDAKDLDDGVYAERLAGGGFKLGVYIADVSWYVRENMPLDMEARQRGTSVYLADRVVPMLPRELSNGICSLNAGTDRLAMACEIEFTSRGRIVGYDIFPTVIHVYRRLTYKLVNKILVEGDEILRKDNEDILPRLEVLAALRNILKAKHRRKGALDFALPEIKVNLDEKGHPVGLIKREDGLAESIVEECMLAANEVVAEHLHRRKIPGLYRVHEPPGGEKMQRLNSLLNMFSLHLPQRKRGISPKDVQRILTKIVGTPEEKLVSVVTLRSMQQARYDAKNLGHFGLAAKYYTHFTSPIRRYPDLIVHRMLRENLTPERTRELKMLLPEIAALASARERRAVEAERETVDLKKVEYMRDFVGEKFSGIISGVQNFGLFVELDNGVEGLVSVRSMKDDYYEFFSAKFALIGEVTRRQYRLGDRVEVIVERVNLAERNIDLILADKRDRSEAKNKSAKVGGRQKHKHKSREGRSKTWGKRTKALNRSAKTAKPDTTTSSTRPTKRGWRFRGRR